MGYDHASYTDVEPRAPGMYFLRDALDSEALGVTVVEADDGWEGLEHDHTDGDHEEVYLLLSGSASLIVDGERIEMDAGSAVRVDPESTRRLTFDADDSQMVIAGAP